MFESRWYKIYQKTVTIIGTFLFCWAMYCLLIRPFMPHRNRVKVFFGRTSITYYNVEVLEETDNSIIFVDKYNHTHKVHTHYEYISNN